MDLDQFEAELGKKESIQQFVIHKLFRQIRYYENLAIKVLKFGFYFQEVLVLFANANSYSGFHYHQA